MTDHIQQDKNEKRDRRPTMERHIQTFLLALVVALICWVGDRLITVSDTQIAMKASVEVAGDKVAALNKDVADLRGQLREFYLRSEAERTNDDIYGWLRRHDERLIKLEREVRP